MILRIPPRANSFFFDCPLFNKLGRIVVSFGEHRVNLALALAVHNALQGLVLASAHSAIMTPQSNVCNVVVSGKAALGVVNRLPVGWNIVGSGRYWDSIRECRIPAWLFADVTKPTPVD